MAEVVAKASSTDWNYRCNAFFGGQDEKSRVGRCSGSRKACVHCGRAGMRAFRPMTSRLVVLLE